MIDIPAWGWQVLTGSAAGLILGGLYGAWRMGRHAARERVRQAQSSRFMTVAPDTRQQAAGAGGEPALDPAVVRMIDRLREQNRQLAGQLRELKETSAPRVSALANGPDSTFDLVERCTSLERQLDELRRAHTQELSQLMRTVLEQFDALQSAHAQQVQALQAQLGGGADSLALREAAQTVQQTARTVASAFGRAG